MNHPFLTAFGLMLLFEGLLPLLLPQAWRETFKPMLLLKDGQLRFFGLVSVIVGLVVILLAK